MNAILVATRPQFGNPNDMANVTYEPEPRTYAEARQQFLAVEQRIAALKGPEMTLWDHVRIMRLRREADDLLELLSGERFAPDEFEERSAMVWAVREGFIGGIDDSDPLGWKIDPWPDPPYGTSLLVHPPDWWTTLENER